MPQRHCTFVALVNGEAKPHFLTNTIQYARELVRNFKAYYIYVGIRDFSNAFSTSLELFAGCIFIRIMIHGAT